MDIEDDGVELAGGCEDQFLLSLKTHVYISLLAYEPCYLSLHSDLLFSLLLLPLHV